MNLKQNVLIAVFIFAPVMFALATAAEDAAELHQNGIAALKDSQTNPNAIVAVARCFAKASALYEASGKTEFAVEMNSYLYWCKKKMSMADIDAFLKGEDTTVSARLTAVESKSPVPSEAQAWLDRANAFVRANPSEHLLAAVRFFEVADRFKDTDVGRAAMSKSLAEMQQVVAQKATPEKKAEAKPGKRVNLLTLIDPTKDAVEGKWSFTGTTLVGEKSDKRDRIEIPYQPPEEYDFKVVFMMLDNAGMAGQVIQKSDRQFFWFMGGECSGLEQVDGKPYHDNSTTFKGELVKPGQWHECAVQVRNDGITVVLDKKPVMKFKTSYQNLSSYAGWKLRDMSVLGLANHSTKIAFSSIELIEISGSGKKSR